MSERCEFYPPASWRALGARARDLDRRRRSQELDRQLEDWIRNFIKFDLPIPRASGLPGSSCQDAEESGDVEQEADFDDFKIEMLRANPFA